MYYIVGLGNPGEKYKQTRHNVGFEVLEHVAATKSFSSWYDKSAYSGTLAEGTLGSEAVTLMLPQTFMNDSGSAVKKLVAGGDLKHLIVVYDDIDLPFGELKISFGRGAGGHNGIRSIIDTLGTQDFIRVRVGVAQKSLFTGSLKRPKGEALASFVLGAFTRSELKKLPEVLGQAGDAVVACVCEGRERAMNQFNKTS